MKDYSNFTKCLGLIMFLNSISGISCQEHEGGEHEVEHFEVFHVEWERVEIPYVIGLWILVTTLVKLCKSFKFRHMKPWAKSSSPAKF